MNFQDIAANANQLTVISLLAMMIIVGVVSLHRGYIVLGSQYQECIRDRDKFEVKVEALAEANALKVSRLEADNQDLRARMRGGTTR